MPPQRVLVVVGTRPEAVKLAPIVLALRQASWAEARVVATAQHRQLLDEQLAVFGIRPDLDLDLMQPGQTLAQLTSRLLAALDPVLVDERPDMVMAQGDTTTVMATAMACFYRHIPFAHVEAGLRTGDLQNPFPEEWNRLVVGRIASLHFAPTPGAQQNLLREGTPEGSVLVTGNTVIDALLWMAARVDASAFAPPAGKRLLLVTAHRRENFGAPFAAICDALRMLADRPDVQLLMPVHPNPNVQNVARQRLGDHPSIQLVPPVDYPTMVAAMRACTLVLTDSGGVQEEAPSLGKPVLVLRTTTERPEGVAAGAAKLVGTDPERIVAEATRLLDEPAAYAAMAQVKNPYGDGRAAPRIVEAVRSFLQRRR